MTAEKPKITLPCDFTIKILGADSVAFEVFVKKSVLTYFPDTKESAWKKQISKAGKYASFTVTIYLRDENDMKQLKETLETHVDFKLIL